MKDFRFLLYAILLYAPTLVYARVEIFLLVIAAVFFFEWTTIKVGIVDFKKTPFSPKHFKTVWLIVIIVAVSLLNKIFNGFEILGPKDYY